MSPFVALQLSLVVTATAFCLVGSVMAKRRMRLEQRQEQAYGRAASLILGSGTDLGRACHQLTRYPSSVLARVLQELALDTSGEARRRLRAVAQHTGLVRRVERMSRHRSWRRRVQAAHLLMLVSGGAEVRDRLLADRHPLVRARAIESVDPLGGPGFADQLMLELDDPSSAVRSAARQALNRGGADFAPQLVAALESANGCPPSLDVLVGLVEVAVHVPDRRLVEAAVAFVDHDEARVRCLVSACLGHGLIDGEPLLKALLTDCDASVRSAAALAIGNGRLVHLAPCLGRCLGDTQWSVRRAAGQALAQLGPAGLLVLRHHADDPDPFAQDMALHILSRLLLPSKVAVRPIPVVVAS